MRRPAARAGGRRCRRGPVPTDGPHRRRRHRRRQRDPASMQSSGPGGFPCERVAGACCRAVPCQSSTTWPGAGRTARWPASPYPPRGCRDRTGCPVAVASADLLAAVDFSEAWARGVAIAGLRCVRGFNARLLALPSERFEPPPSFTVDRIEESRPSAGGAEAAAVRYLAQFVATATAYGAEPIVSETAARRCNPTRRGRRADPWSSDLHRRHQPVRWWLGSVAERVVRTSTVPVLVTSGSERAATREFRARRAGGRADRRPRIGRAMREGLAATVCRTGGGGRPLTDCTARGHRAGVSRREYDYPRASVVGDCRCGGPRR